MDDDYIAEDFFDGLGNGPDAQFILWWLQAWWLIHQRMWKMYELVAKWVKTQTIHGTVTTFVINGDKIPKKLSIALYPCTNSTGTWNLSGLTNK